jgi:hypothetical protein
MPRYRFTLFNRSGNVIYSTSPYKFSNAITNICTALSRQTAKDPSVPQRPSRAKDPPVPRESP